MSIFRELPILKDVKMRLGIVYVILVLSALLMFGVNIFNLQISTSLGGIIKLGTLMGIGLLIIAFMIYKKDI